MSFLGQLVEQAMSPSTKDVQVSIEDYLAWREHFLFETLQYGTRYGQSFCNKFDITDYILYYMLNVESADKHIRKHYVQ